MHSDQNYLVDQSLFGSSTTRNPSTNTGTNRNKIICKSEDESLQENIEILLNELGVRTCEDSITFLNMKDSCVITFKNSNECEPVMKRLKEKIPQSNLKISVDWYEPKDERNVYVRNLPLDFTDSQLRDLFQFYGSIISVKLIRKEQNNNCIGFVRYQSKMEAEKAIKEINIKNINLIGSERYVHCELSKVYNTFGTVSQYGGEIQSAPSMQHQVPINVSNIANNNYNIVSQIPNQTFINFSHQPNSMFVQPIQLPPMYANVPVPFQIIYGVPQQHIIQQEFDQNPVMFIQLPPYNTQNN